jgi:hypothetical protein
MIIIIMFIFIIIIRSSITIIIIVILIITDHDALAAAIQRLLEERGDVAGVLGVHVRREAEVAGLHKPPEPLIHPNHPDHQPPPSQVRNRAQRSCHYLSDALTTAGAR